MIVIIVPINPCLLLIECMSISQRSPNNARCLSAWIPSLVRCVGVMEKNIILSIKNVWLKKFFWIFNLQSSIQDSWLKKFFWIFNLQSRTLDWRSFSGPSIFNLQSRTLDWRSFSGPSIFNLQSSIQQSRTLDCRSSSVPSIFNPGLWIEEVFLDLQSSIFNPGLLIEEVLLDLQSSIFNPGLWIEEVFLDLQSSIFNPGLRSSICNFWSETKPADTNAPVRASSTWKDSQLSVFFPNLKKAVNTLQITLPQKTIKHEFFFSRSNSSWQVQALQTNTFIQKV